jgi:hypothetical protein
MITEEILNAIFQMTAGAAELTRISSSIGEEELKRLMKEECPLMHNEVKRGIFCIISASKKKH